MADYQLEIHHIDVRGGDATLIVCRKLTKVDDSEDGKIVYRMLIDAGGVGSGPKRLLNYFQKYYSDMEVDLFIASHYHDDHIRGIIQKKSKENNDYWIKVKQLCDIGDSAKTCFPTAVKVYDAHLSREPRYFKRYKKFRSSVETKNNPDFIDPEYLKKNNEDQTTYPLGFIEINIPGDNEDSGFQYTILTAKGVLLDGTDVISTQCKLPTNANDLSISFVVYNKNTGFSYFSGGDLSGDPDLKEYYNIEGPLFKKLEKYKVFSEGFLKDGIKVVKASHHGSDRNNHSYKKNSNKVSPAPGFFEFLKPEVTIIPCNQPKKVPGPDYLDSRLFNYLSNNTDSRAYFLNQIEYSKKKHKDMYGALAKILSDVTTKNSTNLIERFENSKLYPRITHSSSSAFVVVTSTNKRFIDVYDKNSDAAPKVVFPPKNVTKTYQVVCNTLGPKESTSNVTSDHSQTLEAYYEDYFNVDIKKGFKEQAEEIVDAFFIALNPKKHELLERILEYFEDDFPSLKEFMQDFKNQNELKDEKGNNTEEAKAAIKKMTTAMESVFLDYYTISKEKNPDRTCYELKKNPQNADDERETTLANLLRMNRFQVILAASIRDYDNNYITARGKIADLSVEFVYNRWGIYEKKWIVNERQKVKDIIENCYKKYLEIKNSNRPKRGEKKQKTEEKKIDSILKNQSEKKKKF